MSRFFSVVDKSPNDLLSHTVDLKLDSAAFYSVLLYLQIGDVKCVLTSLFRSCVN